jgi:hypothetical protein
MFIRLEDGKAAYTSHASKKSKISFKFMEVHTSVMLPLLACPLAPFPTTFKIALTCIIVLILLERRGWTVALAARRFRSRMAGKTRHIHTRRTLERRMKLNK